jgi:hypothetical protein
VCHLERHAANWNAKPPQVCILVDTPRMRVTRIVKGKEREDRPRLLALLNHYVSEPVAAYSCRKVES